MIARRGRSDRFSGAWQVETRCFRRWIVQGLVADWIGKRTAKALGNSSREGPFNQRTTRVCTESQQSYADKRRKDIKFEVGEKVFLKVSPMRGVIRFGKKGKLQPRFIGPFEILDRVGDLAYRLALPPELSAVHNVFHVSILRRYVHDPEYICNYEELQVAGNLTYEEVHIAILEQKVHKLRNKDISLVKVQWSRHGVNEAT
ncbi:hypothetical protein OROMI_004338 [Orobanche minor]